MKIDRLIVFLVFALAGVQGSAQNIASGRLNWNSVTTITPVSGNTTDEATQLVTYGGDSIQWIAPDGTLRYTLSVTAINGTWSDVSQTGSIVYEVDNKGFRGVIFIERSSVLKARMIINTDAEPSVYELSFDSVKTL